jgi:3-oxoacid CoA-transferase subunit B
VKKIITDLAVLEITQQGFKLLEKAPGVSVEEIKDKTAGKLIVDKDVIDMQFF